jgi:hypothetical protein
MIARSNLSDNVRGALLTARPDRTPQFTHPVNLSLGHGAVIQEVSGSGNSRASDTASHPSGNGIERFMPLRETQLSSPHASHAIASSRVVRTSWAT